jgi:pimeloyl-ACP methyl ester carboxylesterase
MRATKLQNLEERWIICGGIPVHFWQSNDDSSSDQPTLVHVHGFGISGRYLLPTADLLAKEYRTFVPNLPGYGRSIHPVNVLSIPELADAMVEFFDTVGIERATLIGNSMGCIIAIETARIAPERVAGLVLVSPAGGDYNRPIFKGVAQLALDGLREPPRMGTIAIPDYLKFGLISAGRLFWQMIHYPTVDRFRETSCEALVVLGEHDPLVSEQRITEGIVANESVQVVRVHGAAHAINYSHPNELASLVRVFLSGAPLEDNEALAGTTILMRKGRGEVSTVLEREGTR